MGARTDKWRSEYPLQTAGPPRSQFSCVSGNPVYTTDSFLRTHTIWRNKSYGDTTPRTQHDFTNGQLYFHSAPRQTGMGRQWRKGKFSWYFKERYSAIHPLTIFHSAFSCSNINSFSSERRARLVNDCSSCVTPTGLPQLSYVRFHSQPKDFGI